jgi:hypothetical protein
MVALNTETMEAKLLYEWSRPDGRLSDKRGNVHIMPNGNVLVGWSQDGYMTEHTMDDELVMEARFVSTRFSTYRVFKANFTGVPTDPPAIESYISQSSSDVSYAMTTSYVSWNGATEVSSWKFYGSQNSTNGFRLVGEARKVGFETAFSEKGSWPWVYAEAIAKNGSAIGQTKVRPARFLPGPDVSLKSKSGIRFLSTDKSALAHKFRELDNVAISVGTVFVMLALQLAGFALYLVLRRGRRGKFTFTRWSTNFDEDQVQLLSTKEVCD